MHVFWLESFHSDHAISYMNCFVFSRLDPVGFTLTDEWKQNKSVLSRLDYMEANKQTELKKCSIITTCKYLTLV